MGFGKRQALYSAVPADYDVMTKKKLQLLGIWNEPPLFAWIWHCDAAKEHFYKLTGLRIHSFTYVKDGLDYYCFLPRALSILKARLERLSDDGQITYMRRIEKDYYAHVGEFESFLKKYKNSKFKNFKDRELIDFINAWAKAFSKLTMQVWCAVFLDIWYPSEQEKGVIKKFMGKMRDHLGRRHNQSRELEKKLYAEIGKRIHTSFNGMFYLFPEEIINALKKRKTLEPLAQERMKFCVTTDEFGSYRAFAGARAKKIARTYDLPKQGSKKQNILHGMPAHPGAVKGKVRKVLLDSEFPKFKQGEILVALQTMVHYIPLMKKSKAILTEFGGLTSHAAIVSRELGKPCVVGIPNLIASLKDGDLVEVDAEKGVVRKLGAEVGLIFL